jgi:uncharacterized repeat protein (TIGR01451 family)
MDRLTYVLQAVDRQGNVSWKLRDLPTLESGVSPQVADTVAVEILPSQTDLGLDLEISPSIVQSGDPAELRARVSEQGIGAASGVRVEIVVPDGFLSSGMGGSGWACEGNPSLVCTRDSLATGTESELRLFFDTPDQGGVATFVGQVFAQETDPWTANDLSTAEITVVAPNWSDLEVIKTAGGAAATVGQETSWSITVSNRGPNEVVGALVTDLFPPEVASPHWICAASLGSYCAPEGSGDIEEVVNLAADGTLLFLATATVVAPGDLSNTAEITLPAEMFDYRPENNISTARTPDAGSILFLDGFEDGDCLGWSACVGSPEPQ